MSVLGTFSLALFLKSTTIYRTIEHTQNRIIAFHMAESGLDRGITALKQDSSYTGQGYTVFGGGGYDVTVETPDPVNNPTVRRITANGYAPSNSPVSYAYEGRQVMSYVSLTSEAGFNFGLFGDSNVTLGGRAVTDSFNSKNGAYKAPGGANGDVGTNGTGQGTVQLTGNAAVGGDVVVGMGGDPATAIQAAKNATISGTKSAATSPTTLTSVTIPSFLTDSGALSVSGQNTVTLPGGTYWYDSISVSGGGSVKFAGPATIYVSGTVSISGSGTVTSGDLPPNLTIKVKDDVNVSVTGGGTFYGAIYAPKSDVSISGNGALFGAVVGKTLSFSGSGKDPLMIHYDEALQTAGAGSGTGNKIQMRSWQET